MIKAVITGPTGIGKSKFVLDLAEKLNAEIIGADSRQIYSEVAIGVATPPKEDLERVPHHLVGFKSIIDSYSVGEYYKDVQNIQNRHPNKDYIVVGGTGFYIKAITQGLVDLPQVELCARQKAREELEAMGHQLFYESLEKIDSIALDKVKPTDTHRLLRIKEVYLQTGKSWSSFISNRLPALASAPIIELSRPRDELYSRINSRVNEMIKTGWVDEVIGLSGAGFSFSEPGLNSLGYSEIHEILKSAHMVEKNVPKGTRAELIELISKKTRNYAKRQLTFVRTQIPNTFEIPIEKGYDLSAICEKIKKNNFF